MVVVLKVYTNFFFIYPIFELSSKPVIASKYEIMVFTLSDLSVCDYWLWDYLKDRINQRKTENLDYLEIVIRRETKNLDKKCFSILFIKLSKLRRNV